MTISLIGNPETHPLERRVLNAAILGSSIITLFILIQSLILGYSQSTILLIFAITSIFWFLYFIGKRKKEIFWTVWVYLIFNESIIILDWLYVGGFSGAGLLIFLVLTGLMPLFLKKKQLKFGIAFNIATILIISYGFISNSEYILRYVPTESRVWEKFTEIIIFSAGVFVVSMLVISAYRKERETIRLINVTLSDKNFELKSALAEVKTLQGLIPICANCKQIKNDAGFYESVEEYFSKCTDVDFSHAVCPECEEKLYGNEDWYQELKKKREERNNG